MTKHVVLQTVYMWIIDSGCSVEFKSAFTLSVTFNSSDTSTAFPLGAPIILPLFSCCNFQFLFNSLV